jgi:hypothetical protein
MGRNAINAYQSNFMGYLVIKQQGSQISWVIKLSSNGLLTQISLIKLVLTQQTVNQSS